LAPCSFYVILITFLKPLNLPHFYLPAVAEHKNLNDLINFINAELKKLAVWFKANNTVVNVKKNSL
jgi:hypothetical protein